MRSVRQAFASIIFLFGCLCSANAEQSLTPEAQGHADRQAFEVWVGGLIPAQRQGANFWTQERSKPRPVPCLGTEQVSQPDFVAGCQEAQRRLALSDVRRRTEPGYRVGWNASILPPSIAPGANATVTREQTLTRPHDDELATLQQRALRLQSEMRKQENERSNMSSQLSEKLVTYVSIGMAYLETKKVHFDSTDDVLWQIEATSRSAGLGTPSFSKVDPDGHLRLVHVMSSSDPIVSPAGTDGWYIRFQSRMDWEENSPQCKFTVRLEVMNIPEQKYDCRAFVQGRSATQFNNVFEDVVRKMLTQVAKRNTDR